jgi:hypothetical protein
MPVTRPIALFCILALSAVPARAQSSGSDAGALKSSVMQVLSLATFGMIPVQDMQAAVIQDGADYRMRLPLPGLTAPADAAISAVARPLDNGRVDIESMAFPSSGTFETTLAAGVTNRIEFSVGKQTISGLIDPTPTKESTYTAEFGDVRLATAQGEQRGEQTIDHLATDGSFSTGADGRLTFVTQSRATGFHMIAHGPNGLSSDTNVRAMAGHFSVEGLDRAQGAQMVSAFRELMAAVQAQHAEIPVGQVPPAPAATPEQRRQLRALVDAVGGLLSRVEADETMQDVQFSVGTASGNGAGTIGSVRLTMAGDVEQEHVNTRFGVAVDRIAVPAMAAETGALIPHHVDLKTVLAGVPVARVMALLRAATADHADPVLLQDQARALLDDPDARVAIEELSFDAGPLSVTGSAKLLPRANGQFGGDIHIAAHGVDALLAQMQSQPKLQQALPIIFMAKGMGRAQGDGLVWDIVLGDGPLTINGMPFGQPAGKTR